MKIKGGTFELFVYLTWYCVYEFFKNVFLNEPYMY